ncbi:hypothetical protein BG015_006646 [Linnemannia schmuckeri]|uniref:F-box domain-containing protein n=1 Tax=Linnemannia schmuckeri TaxID=64567 RepID=A0A9P5S6J3_9FUNG|nr:hypothetical protein BG015_006646 [Linnemannia schmuckeri]
MTSSNSEAIAIPEILQNVFLHLDRPSLHACARVSRLWRSWSLHIAWLFYYIPSQDIIDFLAQRRAEKMSVNGDAKEAHGEADYEEYSLNKSKKLRFVQEFKKQCFRIQSLTVGDDSHSKLAVMRSVDKDNLPEWACALPTNLTNLVHLRFGFHYHSHLPADSNLSSDILSSLISQNPNLQHLEFLPARQPSYRVLFTALKNSPLQQLKRLELCCDLENNGLSELLDLLAVQSKFEILEQDQECSLEPTTPGWKLEELIIRSRGNSSFERFVIDSRNNTDSPRPVAVRKLTLFNFCPAVYVDEQELDENGRLQIDWSLLYHLCRRFPVLQRLQFSSNISIDYKPSPLSFEHHIYNFFRDLDEFESSVFWQPEELARAMIKACPKLTEIDLSHHRELHPEDWDILLQHYAPQLESLSAWSVDQMQPQELMRLVPPSPALIDQFGGHPSQKWVGLQRLDISANSVLAPAIHMFLKYVPTLRHFKALGVPVEANQLLGFDWVCTGMETLAIHVLIPTQAWPNYVIWRWDVSKDRWRMISEEEDSLDDDECECLAMDVEVPIFPTLQESYGSSKKEDSSSDSDSDTNSDTGSDTDSSSNSDSDTDSDSDAHSDTSTDSSAESSSDSSSESDSSDSESDAGSSTDSGRSGDESSAALGPTGAPGEALPKKRVTHSMQIQIAICQQLGRLTRLKELTLEGRQDYRYDNKEWDCLRLTLKTGLDYLRPLQANLKKLVVFQLDEELCGREEMEWIAQNWVHQDNIVWKSAIEACGGSRSTSPGSASNSATTLGGEVSGAGVSVCGREKVSALEANMNIAWLEGQCRRLTVEKDVARNRESFFYGQYQDY